MIGKKVSNGWKTFFQWVENFRVRGFDNGGAGGQDGCAMKKPRPIVWFYGFLGLLAAFCLYVGIGGISYCWPDRVYRRLCAAKPGTRAELEHLLPVCRTKAIRLEDSNCLYGLGTNAATFVRYEIGYIPWSSIDVAFDPDGYVLAIAPEYE